MTNFLMTLLGYLFICWAVFFNRSDDSEIKLFSKEWFIVMILVLIGTAIIRNYLN